MTMVAIFVLIFFVGISNIYAWHSAVGFALEQRFAPVYTIGGLLTHGLFNAAFRIIGALGLVSFVFLAKKKRTWLDYVGVVLIIIALVMGTERLVSKGHWVLAILLWFTLQNFQFEGIFENQNPVIKLMALGSYCLEYLVQCVAVPISDTPVLELLNAMQLGALTIDQIFWAPAFLNLACMVGVEWLFRLQVAIRTKS